MNEDIYVGPPVQFRTGIDRLTVDGYASLLPLLTDAKYAKRNTRVYYRDHPFYYHQLLPVQYFSGIPNDYCAIPAHLSHAASNRNKFPNVVLKWFPNGKSLLAGTQGGKLIVWNGLTFHFEDIKRFPVSSGSVTALEWAPTGDLLVAGDEYGKVALLSQALSLLDTKIFEGFSKTVYDLSLSPNASKLAGCADSFAPIIWDVSKRAIERRLTGEHIDASSATCLQWHTTMALVAAGTRTNCIHLWDPRADGSAATIHAHKSAVNKIQFNPKAHTNISNALLSAGRDGMVKVWDLRLLTTPTQVHKLPQVQDEPTHVKYPQPCFPSSIAWHPIQTNIFSVADNKSRIMYYTTDLHQEMKLLHINLPQLPDRDVCTLSMAWHPLGHLLASCSDDKFVRFWCRSPPGGIRGHCLNVKMLQDIHYKQQEWQKSAAVIAVEAAGGSSPSCPFSVSRFKSHSGAVNGWRIGDLASMENFRAKHQD
ncbi:pre-mRNA 3' end processing protein WDR33 [Babesia microti strain RI]|uniref:Pre-mRNA 3' end processing protein WDR33 n=1 Tax=Babesia microti (strain RI) TaxID=1133968 RepID=A0A1R4ABH5_BABMR|nr:pre-mRNA 3' end processing protein WDR33 [Babesia microti strain RI]SJK86348.1 pre-mRNA 3' end processing protein WDR33 [Babesia microti strain RI]|eukprot:XP_012648906.2 pre-mRNA 3' end processing protein WDR33 [Babesia microti strain RI]